LEPEDAAWLADLAVEMEIQPRRGVPFARDEQIDEMMDRHEVAVMLKAEIERLPEKERAIVELHHFGDATIEEAGLLLGVDKSWASRLHTRALDLLRRALRPRVASGALDVTRIGSKRPLAAIDAAIAEANERRRAEERRKAYPRRKPSLVEARGSRRVSCGP
jgi:hypothetical protein